MLIFELEVSFSFIKSNNLHIPSVKMKTLMPKMNHDSDEESKDLATAILNSDQEVFIVSEKNKKIIELYK